MIKNVTSIILGILIGSAISGNALEWSKCLQYKFQSADPKTAWMLQDDGNGVYIRKWNLPDTQPTKAELEAIEPQAIAWYTDKVNTAEANFELWDKPELIAFVKVMMDEINILRAQHGLAPRTFAQLKAAIKNKL
jgi:hypothetical protein